MANKMLIDASHPEETRVVVVRGNKVEEFDFESASRKQLRGNIYLAKVTRVEPSLQAAFVEYGGNRHGFLAFSEIHPDYYQIPVADRQALLEEEAHTEHDLDHDDERGNYRNRPVAKQAARKHVSISADAEEGSEENASLMSVTESLTNVTEIESDDSEEDQVEQVGGSTDALEELPDRRQRPLRRQYKIQEVIKRRQVLLIQVVKEERGNKGAALTTYLSLAGRYSVLMPNTARGGGISRKITNIPDRKRLKAIAQELEVPDGMGVIVRTAGASRTKAEIKRDFEYLLRMWESVRELTLQSSAPALVYEEGSLIKRAIRDLYNKDIDEVHVSGDEGYREAKDFMRMLMPSHAKAVQPYKDIQPLFARSGVEAQLDAMFSSQVTLKSGGYIVINPTEALVSIDVNSGRSTREHNIEDTAYRTNLEAAEEVSRQLRLRDLAGLIVIDFIDMEDKRNVRNVEKKLKDCLKDDRARIQVGRISAFGLMEMSRQRIRTGVLESSSVPCAHCAGTGFVRATPSIALHILRAIEEALIKSAGYEINVKTRTEVALYVLNQKRVHLRELETRFGAPISILADDINLTGTNYYVLERGEAVTITPARAPITGVQIEAAAAEVNDAGEKTAEAPRDNRRQNENHRHPRPRHEGGSRPSHMYRVPVSTSSDEEISSEIPAPEMTATSATPATPNVEQAEGDSNGRRRRRRRRRGGRRNGDGIASQSLEGAQIDSDASQVDGDDGADDDFEADLESSVAQKVIAETDANEAGTAEAADDFTSSAPARRNRRSNPRAAQANATTEAQDDDKLEASSSERRRTPRRRTKVIAEMDQGDSRHVTSNASSDIGAAVEALKPEPAVTLGSWEPAGSNTSTETLVVSQSSTEVETPDAHQAAVSTTPRPKRFGWWSRKPAG
ncbi:Rne/Rng family ribonuclease [Pseudochelatococcus sp. G4_1912]|uniref:Rne/Rng family ribonuclease n=1 Tax=Pseudochelatococcus sp. G4_1912 TaxID=3114288 RepID=UPI0039C738A5